MAAAASSPTGALWRPLPPLALAATHLALYPLAPPPAGRTDASHDAAATFARPWGRPWRIQHFALGVRMPAVGMALRQRLPGPCGVLAVVQAEVVRHLMFGPRDALPDTAAHSTASLREAVAHWRFGAARRADEPARRPFVPSRLRRNAALVAALADIIWRCRRADDSVAWLVLGESATTAATAARAGAGAGLNGAAAAAAAGGAAATASAGGGDAACDTAFAITGFDGAMMHLPHEAVSSDGDGGGWLANLRCAACDSCEALADAIAANLPSFTGGEWWADPDMAASMEVPGLPLLLYSCVVTGVGLRISERGVASLAPAASTLFADLQYPTLTPSATEPPLLEMARGDRSGGVSHSIAPAPVPVPMPPIALLGGDDDYCEQSVVHMTLLGRAFFHEGEGDVVIDEAAATASAATLHAHVGAALSDDGEGQGDDDEEGRTAAAEVRACAGASGLCLSAGPRRSCYCPSLRCVARALSCRGYRAFTNAVCRPFVAHHSQGSAAGAGASASPAFDAALCVILRKGVPSSSVPLVGFLSGEEALLTERHRAKLSAHARAAAAGRTTKPPPRLLATLKPHQTVAVQMKAPRYPVWVRQSLGHYEVIFVPPHDCDAVDGGDDVDAVPLLGGSSRSREPFTLQRELCCVIGGAGDGPPPPFTPAQPRLHLMIVDELAWRDSHVVATVRIGAEAAGAADADGGEAAADESEGSDSMMGTWRLLGATVRTMWPGATMIRGPGTADWW